VPPTPTLQEALIAADEVQRARDFFERTSNPQPSLEEILVAADQVQRARDFFDRTSNPEPTLEDVLVAADQVQRARDFFVRASGAGPSLKESLVAADQLQKFTQFVLAASAPPPPPSSAPPAPTSTLIPPPPPPTSTPVPPTPTAAVQQAAPAEPVVDSGAGYFDAAFEAAVLAEVNERRTLAGLGPLSVEPRLTTAAKNYAKMLADYDWFSHTGPDGSDLVSRIEAAGFPFTVQVGEVLAWGADGWPAKDIVQAWMDSPGHRAQIMSAVYTRAGVGCYFTDEGTSMVRCVMDLAG
jgi:uncharacterized protein YkwD